MKPAAIPQQRPQARAQIQGGRATPGPPLTTANAPAPRAMDSRDTVWTGNALLFFGGWNGLFFNDTWLYRRPASGSANVKW